jgi:uncharacterized membrane protein YhhN
MVWPGATPRLEDDNVPRVRTVLPSAVYIGIAVADSVAAGRRGGAARRLRYVLKPMLMPALALAFLDGTRGGRARADSLQLLRGTATAQAFSWGGDVALLGTGQRAFLTGVASFFGAHVAYVATFSSMRGPRDEWDTTGLRVALGLWLTAGPVMSVAARRKDPALGAPVAAYVTILSAMFASSRMLDPALPAGARSAIRAGTALFLVSDGVLAAQTFLLREPRPALDSFVMATYTAGQGLVAAGVAGAGGPPR